MSEAVQKPDKYNLRENAMTHLICQSTVSESQESPIKYSPYENGKPLTLGTRSYLNNSVMYTATQLELTFRIPVLILSGL